MSVKKASAVVILICLLGSALCIPFDEFYSKQFNLLQRTIIPRGNVGYSNPIRFSNPDPDDDPDDPFYAHMHKSPYFYMDEEPCITVSC